MAVVQRKKYLITVYRGLDYPQTFFVPGDYSGYEALAECRETEAPSSTLICNLNATIGTYDPITGRTPCSILITRDISAKIAQEKGYWSYVMIEPVADIAQQYISGIIVFADDPTGDTLDDLPVVP